MDKDPLGIPRLLHKYSFLIGTLSTQRHTYTVVKVGGGMGQSFLTEVTYLELNQPPVFLLFFCSVSTSEVAMMLNAQ